MRYIPMFRAEAGMILIYDVYDSLGRNLIAHHSVLTDAYIQKLMNMGIDGVYIEDELSDGIEIGQVISPELRAKGLQCVRNKDVDACKKVAAEIVKQMMENDTCNFDMVDLRTYDDYTFAHSVNVATVACAIGLGMELSQDDLENIVLAGLLHDLGKLEIPTEILNKPGRLSQEEYMLIKTHAIMSYDIIKERLDISAQVKQAVLCHHENMDGSGYPTGISGENLSQITRILHVADVYDALVSQRTYKKPYSQWEALEYIKGGSGTLFAPETVEALSKYIPFYPKGSYVIIDDGREAVVVDNIGDRNTRPLIRFFDKTQMDLLAEENKDVKIISPSDESSDYMEESEKARADMVKELKRCKVAFIDASENSYEFVKDKLSYLYDVLYYKSVNFAIGFSKKEGMPDLFVYDEDDKNTNGQDEIRKLMEFTNNKVPVMIISSSPDIRNVLAYRDLGVMRYVLKPFTIVYIRSELRNLLHNHSDVSI